MVTVSSSINPSPAFQYSRVNNFLLISLSVEVSTLSSTKWGAQLILNTSQLCDFSKCRACIFVPNKINIQFPNFSPLRPHMLFESRLHLTHHILNNICRNELTDLGYLRKLRMCQHWELLSSKGLSTTSVAEKPGLCSRMLNRNTETELWRSGKEQLYYSARLRGPQQANALKTVPCFLGVGRGLIVLGWKMGL